MMPTLTALAASAVDRAFVRALERRPRRVMGHAERMEKLAAVRDAYARANEFFPAPPPVEPSVRAVAGRPGVLDLSWPSASAPFLEPFAPAYVGHAANRTAHARLFVDGAPRPAVILVHGYLGGRWGVEERAWPIAWMRRRGLDVALALLPFHALRSERGQPPRFPGADPRYTNEGFRQAIFDLRTLAAVLRARGAPAVGVMGMSLGGYTTALWATLDESLAFAVPVIPLASIADFARDNGRLGRGAEVALQHRALDEAVRVVSPLARPARVASERVLVVGADADRITPIAHAERLARHLGAPLFRIPGGHLLQIGRGEAFRAVARMWGRLGLG
jgi:pimeloyl-ACP methyl ester carboxylesterase